LTKHWTEVNSSVFEKFAGLSPQEWLRRHTAMSDEDYAKDPTRNRLSVLLSRTNHLSYHLGQIVLAPDGFPEGVLQQYRSLRDRNLPLMFRAQTHRGAEVRHDSATAEKNNAPEA